VKGNGGIRGLVAGSFGIAGQDCQQLALILDNRISDPAAEMLNILGISGQGPLITCSLIKLDAKSRWQCRPWDVTDVIAEADIFS